MFKILSIVSAIVAVLAFLLAVGVYCFADPSVRLIIVGLREVIFIAGPIAIVALIVHQFHKTNRDRLRISE